MPIIIFSKPIHSGKTTELFEWSRSKASCGGILMPNNGDSKSMFDIEKQQYFDCIANDLTNQEIISIGKYHFLSSAFDKANQIIINALIKKKEFVIIDEVGKLEINKQGFYKSLYFIINQQHSSKIILVVRDGFVDEVMNTFGIKKCEIFNSVAII